MAMVLRKSIQNILVSAGCNECPLPVPFQRLFMRLPVFVTFSDTLS